MQTTDYKKQEIPLRQYSAYLKRNGGRVIPGSAGTCWTNYEGGAMMRIPKFSLGSPTPHEIRQVFWQGRAAVASYLLEPGAYHPANAWLYVCTNQTYALDTLAPSMRRNVRRGLAALRIEFLPEEELLAHGAQAFCDTRRRAGLNDGTVEIFRRSITGHARLETAAFLGAWKGDTLAAFLTITVVDDWAEFGCYSADAFLQHRPNDTLMYSALSYYLVERKLRLVSYGLSSIQAESNAVGLHRFKLKVGFEARPVHRAFVPHPLLRPFINHWTLAGVHAALRFRPTDRRLKKVGGILEYMLGVNHMPGLYEKSAAVEQRGEEYVELGNS